MRETGTGQQVAQLHERLMMMMFRKNFHFSIFGVEMSQEGKITCDTEEGNGVK